MSLVADGSFLTSAFKSRIIASQCQPFGKLKDSKTYSIQYVNVYSRISISEYNIYISIYIKNAYRLPNRL
jgi:hypothetical protein